ncbi:hypothetical protein DMC01_07710 [Campylobacter troglodytis]|nr:hypothetical protein DMC01_07710 [Campylobacter troglodytis]
MEWIASALLCNDEVAEFCEFSNDPPPKSPFAREGDFWFEFSRALLCLLFLVFLVLGRLNKTA